MITTETEWHASPKGGDLLDAVSWGRLKVLVGDVPVTRVLDREARSERDGVYLPMFDLIEWIVSEWWALLYEPSPVRATGSTHAGLRPSAREWRSRHCLRAGSVGYAAPNLLVSGYGESDVIVTVRSDRSDAHPHTRVQFLEEVSLVGNRSELANSLTKFVVTVLGRVNAASATENARAEHVQRNWEAITSASGDDLHFCESAGRMGLDPYDTDQWPSDVLQWLEMRDSAELSHPMTVDLLESLADPQTKTQQSSRLANLASKQELSGSELSTPRSTENRAYLEGYAAAIAVRNATGLKDEEALKDLRVATTTVTGKSLQIVDAHGEFSGSLLGMAGWKRGDLPLVVTREGLNKSSRRFAGARGLYMLLRGTARGPRLVTDARTWDQRASRAFAAELLAPRAGVSAMHARLTKQFGAEEAMYHIAQHYEVNDRAVEHQLDNAMD